MYIVSILLTILIPFILLSEFFDKPIWIFSKEIIILILCFAFILYYYIRFQLDYNYISFNIDKDKITLRYYSLRPFSKKHKSIEIPNNLYAGYKIEKRFFNLKKVLILYQKLQGKIAKYPAVSLSALNREEFNTLINTLNALQSKR